MAHEVEGRSRWVGRFVGRRRLALVAVTLALLGCSAIPPQATEPAYPAPAPPPAAPPPPPPPAPAPAPVVPAPAPAPPVPTLEKATLAGDVYFDAGSAGLRRPDREELDRLVEEIGDINLEVILIVGHADRTEGAPAAAITLSERRAEALKAYFVSRGIERYRIYTEAKGASQPVADSRSAAGRAKNRRAEVEVVGTTSGRKAAGRTIEVLFATNRARTGDPNPEKFFAEDEATGSEDGRLSLGRAWVSVPPSHHRGEVEEPGLVRVTLKRITQSDIARALKVPALEARDPRRHFTFVRPLELLDAASFALAVRENISRARRHEALLYVHGFANSFADAAARSAQFAYDLTDADHDLAPMMFSWPSDPKKINYFGAADRAWSAGRQLARFLAQLTDATGIGTVHIVAHSRGAQVLGIALDELRAGNLMALRADGRLGPKFNQIILAAPDIRASDFESMVLPAIASGHQVTNYVSSNDEALKFSKRINAGARAGDSGSGVTLVPGVQTIDISAVNEPGLGHSAFAESKRVLTDIAEQLSGKSAEQRRLRNVQRPPTGYWVID